jgi:hypothetical protein
MQIVSRLVAEMTDTAGAIVQRNLAELLYRFPTRMLAATRAANTRPAQLPLPSASTFFNTAAPIESGKDAGAF